MPSAPPINSTTTSISGSAAIAAASSYQRTAERSTPRSRRRSRAETAATTMRRPARWASKSACWSNSCRTPDPTVPRPAMAILNGGFTTATRMRCARLESHREGWPATGLFVPLGRQFFDSIHGAAPGNHHNAGVERVSVKGRRRRIGTAPSVFEQHLGAAFAGVLALRRRLDLDLVGGYSRLGQSGSDRVGTVERGPIAVQLLDCAARGPGIADDANLPRVLPIDRQHRLEGLPILVGQTGRIGAELDLSDGGRDRSGGLWTGFAGTGRCGAGRRHRRQLRWRRRRLVTGRTLRLRQRRRGESPSRSEPAQQWSGSGRNSRRGRQLRWWRRGLDALGLRRRSRLGDIEARLHRSWLGGLSLLAHALPGFGGRLAGACGERGGPGRRNRRLFSDSGVAARCARKRRLGGGAPRRLGRFFAGGAVARRNGWRRRQGGWAGSSRRDDGGR